MKRIDKMFSDLQKLYAKRSALDTQIQSIEASLIAEAKTISKPTVAAVEKPGTKEKPVAKKIAVTSSKPAKK